MKHSVQLFVILFMTFPIFTSCNFLTGKPVYGDHQLVNQQIDISDYVTIIINIPGDVNYQQFSDSAPYFQIHTDENILKALNVRVENNQLIIEAKKDSVIKPSQLTIYTCSHNLNQATLAGAGNLRLKGEVNSKDFKLDITGAGNFLADSLLCNELAAKITGSGKIQLTGASNSALYQITGSGNFHAFNNLVQELDCEITGTGNIEAAVTKKLNANITGAGNISFRGNPESINQKVTGSGKVSSVN